jgi:hypothetical protein
VASASAIADRLVHKGLLLGRDVAIKFLHAEFSSREDIVVHRSF